MTSKRKDDMKIENEIFWKSLSLEWSWNYNYQQQLGYSYVMNSINVKQFNSEKKKVLISNLENFNTNPYFSTFIFATIYSQELMMKSFNNTRVEQLKYALMAPTSALGDLLFWGGLRIISAALAFDLSIKGSLFGPILFLFFFNVPALYIRWKGLKIGLEEGISFLERNEQNGWIRHIVQGTNAIKALSLGGISALIGNEIFPIFLMKKEYYVEFADLSKIIPNFVIFFLIVFIYYLIGKIQPRYILVFGTALCIIASILKLI